MKATGFWAAARNAALKVVAFWVLLLAAYLAIGRQFFPYIDRLEPEIEIWFSEQLGSPVEIGSIKGEWVRFNPVVHLSDVVIGENLTIKNMTLAPGIYESIARGGLSFIRFELVDFSAELIETSSGWTMTGLAQGDANSPIDLSSLLNLVRRQEEVQFTNTQLSVKPLALPPFDLILEQGRLNGYDDENGLIANATLSANGLNVPIELQVEMTENGAGFNRLYFRHGVINLAPWLERVSRQITEASLAGEYWVNLTGEQWKNATARISIDSLIYQGQYRNLTLGDAQLETYLDHKANGFESWFNLLEYQLNGREFGSSQAKLSKRADRIKLQWDSLPAQAVGNWFATTDPGEFWRSISPTGYLEQGSMTLTQGEADSLRVTAQIDDFSLAPYRGVPGLTNLKGQLKMQGARGEMSLSSPTSEFTLPGLFPNPFATQIDTATLQWASDPIQGIFAAGQSSLVLFPPENEQTDDEPVNVELAWEANTPTLSEKERGRESTLEFQLSAQNVSRDWAIRLADNNLVDPNVVALVDRRMERAEFDQFQLDYLVTTDANQKTQSRFFINSEFSEAQVGFLDNWQSVENLSGQLNIDGQGLSIVGRNARYPGFELPWLALALDYDEAVLRADLGLSTDASDLFDFLKTGPLRSLYGDNMDSWFGRGEVNGRASIRVPLATPNDVDVNVVAQLTDNEVVMRNIAMGFSDVSGEISVSTREGLKTNGLTLSHQDLPQQVSIQGDLNSDSPIFTVLASGRTPVAYWGKRFDDAYLASQTADIDHDTVIRITQNDIRIETESSGVGMPLEFPHPLEKSAEEPWPISLSVVLDNRDWTQVRAKVNGLVDSYFELDQNNAIQRGTVAIATELDVRDDTGVYFDIEVDQADGDDWWQAIQSTRTLYADDDSSEVESGPSFESLIRSIHIRGNEVNYLSQPWLEVDATLLRNDDAWLIEFAAAEGQGEVLVPHSDEPIFSDIEWVSITTGEEEIAFKDAVDPLRDYMPADVPPMQLQIGKLIWNQKDLGNWRAELLLEDSNLLVKNIVGEMTAARLTGALTWQNVQSKHQSGFVGQINMRNVLDVLNTWQYAPVLTSRQGLVNIDATWQGSPAHFDFKRMQGTIDLSLEDGAILQVDEYEGIKLIGLLNFTRVIQRIALDFSDLLQEGITFDEIEGQLLFDRGFARVGESLAINGSATKFKFSGDADLLSDELDIDMVLTVPLSSTFPLVALLAGVSPQAAAAIYVTERVFNNELERLSSARMHITGSFEDPQTRFYRVFDNTIGESAPTVGDRIKDVVPEGVGE